MKKLLIVVALNCCFGAIAFAQDGTLKAIKEETEKIKKKEEKEKAEGKREEGWKTGGIITLNLNQGALSNWTAGGEKSTLGINGLFNYKASLLRGKHSWDNLFDVAYGVLNTTSFGKFQKVDDRFDVLSKYGYEAGKSKKLYYSFLMNFRTQFAPGYDYTTEPDTKISNVMTPGYLMLAAGLDYKPNKDISIFFSPVSSRFTFKLDDDFYREEEFGVPAFKRIHYDIGAYLTVNYAKKISEIVAYRGRLDLFSNYRNNPQNVDLFMTNIFAFKVAKYISTTVTLDMIYDDDQIGRLQLKEILGIGFSYKFK